MLDRSKVMAQMKRDTIVIQVRGCIWDQQTYHAKKKLLRNPQRCLSCKNSRKTENRDALQILGIWGYRRPAGDRSGGPSWGRPGPRRGCNTIHGWKSCSINNFQISYSWALDFNVVLLRSVHIDYIWDLWKECYWICLI